MTFKMRYLIAISVGMFMVTNPAASDERTVTVGGGAISCGKIVANIKNVDGYNYFAFHWAQGFLTGLNFEYAPRWESATDLSDNEAQKLWLENYCEENPLDDYIRATSKLWIELRSKQGLEADPPSAVLLRNFRPRRPGNS